MGGRTVELDVRPFHERGEEPFHAIMEAVAGLGPADTLVLVNSFEPLPLYGVMARLGFTHRTEHKGPGEWRITFRREAKETAETRPEGERATQPVPGRELPGDGEAGGRVIELDNRGLAPPEPMVRVLDAAADLRPGDRLVVRNDRRPLFLYPELAERGLLHHTEDLPDGTVRIVIWRE